MNGTVAIAKSIFSNNRAVGFPGANGGGLFNTGSPGGQVLITTTTFADNSSDFPGGGLFNEDGMVTITQSAFVRNQVVFFGGGGGLFNAGGSLFVQNTALATNHVHSQAGGLANGGAALLTNCTVVDNKGDVDGSGGLANFPLPNAQLVILNTIVARNTGPAAGDCIGTVTSLGTNLVGNPRGCTITLLPTDLTGDPGLDDFTDDGTPGNSHFPLLPTSQAIDAGNGAFCPPTDQLGQRRIGPCDIGAIRFLDNTDLQHDDATAATQATK
jgi:hypothetical protein